MTFMNRRDVLKTFCLVPSRSAADLDFGSGGESRADTLLLGTFRLQGGVPGSRGPADLDGRPRNLRARLWRTFCVLVELGGKPADSSPVYGRSEELIGDLLEELGLRNKLFIATKVWTSGRGG